ncbi:MAG: cysteine--tRNA ligase [Candidatus Berkiella sp.]
MLQIHNSFTQQKDIFKPIKAGEISLYVCGITVYDYCHIGHARVFVAFDMIVRFLRASGWQVKYVRNITDIDDKIIKRALENKENIRALTERFIAAMDEDFKALNTLAPDNEPRATEYMGHIIDMVNTLIDKGFAYIADNGDVYFAVDKYQQYGELSHKDLEQLQAGSRVEINEAKRSPLDFVLWKKAKKEEPHWNSPFGEGRPGWHIECSAMSVDCLGESFDIHGGGADLIFPHHENERAQSECATGKKFVNTWMHVGFVQVDKEKMSKSLNNFFTIRDVLAEYEPEVVRYFLTASHYRSPVNYSKDQLEQARSSLERLYTAIRGVSLSQVDPESAIVAPYYHRFFAAMNDDFNSPEAMAVLFDLATATNIARDKKSPNFNLLGSALKALANILGLLESDPEVYLKGKQENVSEIEALITARIEARNSKDWAKADEIRKQLSEMGIVIEDSAGTTTWRRG